MTYPYSKDHVSLLKQRFFTGGCLVYASASLDALFEQGLEGDLIGVDSNGDIHHVLVYVENVGFFDALGWHSYDEVIDFWSNELGVQATLRSVENADLLGYIIADEDDDLYQDAYEDALCELV